MSRNDITMLASLLSILVIAGCSGNQEPSNSESPTVTLPFQELYDQGIDRYLGAFTASSTESLAQGVVQHNFAGLGGPICYTGQEFNMSTRDGAGDELMIFLQGGGVCAGQSCEAVDSIIPLPPIGILSPFLGNPLSTWDVGYVPYCDGSFFTGDNEVDSNGDGTIDRQYRGLQNLSAALDVIANTYPSPTKILLTGNSAGGVGVHFALPLVRKLYPNVRIEMINDSGMSIMNPGTQALFNEEWNSDAFFPQSCNDCIGIDGNLTGYHIYQLAQDPNMRMGFISTKQDERVTREIIGGASAFEMELLTAIDELSLAYPNRFQSLIANGDGHTFILRDYALNVAGITVRDWVTEMVNNGVWQSYIED